MFPHYGLCRGVYDISVNQQLSACQSVLGEMPCPEMKVTSIPATSRTGAGFSPPVSIGPKTLMELLGLAHRLESAWHNPLTV